MTSQKRGGTDSAEPVFKISVISIGNPINQG
jgi:hypothetical protein